MGLGDPELLDDGDGGGKTVSVSCSICLEVVTDNGDRSWAKLQCGHQFHLDCIGSAFNIKGAMQCPNCRKIEKGQWLYANGSRPYTEFNFEDWAQDEDLYDLTYSEMSFGVHWCPFSGLRLPSSFDEGDFSSSAYHDLLGQHAIFAEHTAVSSASHHCPYVAYFGPIPPLSSNSSGNVSDGSNFNNIHWNNQSAPSEIPPSSYAFPSMDAHYHHTWDQHSSLFPTASSRVAGPDQHSIPSMTQRTARTSSDLPRSGSFVHPFLLGHGSNARAGSSVASSMIPPYPGSAARARDRVQALQAYFQHPPSNSPAMRTTAMPGPRRTGGLRSMAQPGPAASSSDHQAGSFYYLPSGSATGRNFSEAENPSRFHTWEREHFPSFLLNQDRDQIWGPVHPQLAGGSTSFRQRHGSERNPSQHW